MDYYTCTSAFMERICNAVNMPGCKIHVVRHERPVEGCGGNRVVFIPPIGDEITALMSVDETGVTLLFESGTRVFIPRGDFLGKFN